MKNTNIIILVGQTGSGKTTIAKALEKDGYKRMVTYTTRPPREDEIDGVDYHFISEDEFLEMIKNGQLAEYADFNASFGHVYYGSTKEEYNTSEKTVIALNPDGLAMVKRNLIPHFSVLLDVSDEEILRRTSQRGDNVEEVRRRLKDDMIKFENIRSEVDLIIAADSVDNITSIIKSL